MAQFELVRRVLQLSRQPHTQNIEFLKFVTENFEKTQKNGRKWPNFATTPATELVLCSFDAYFNCPDNLILKLNF
jgi:hypothetical protein